MRLSRVYTRVLSHTGLTFKEYQAFEFDKRHLCGVHVKHNCQDNVTVNETYLLPEMENVEVLYSDILNMFICFQ